MHITAIPAVRHALLKAALGLSVAAATVAPAFAVDLTFDATCRTNSAIAVAAPNTGITFRKNPNSAVTRASTATIFTIHGLQNIVVPAGGASCFHAVVGNDNYCFQARSTNQIANVNAVPNTNVAGAPVCQ